MCKTPEDKEETEWFDKIFKMNPPDEVIAYFGIYRRRYYLFPNRHVNFLFKFFYPLVFGSRETDEKAAEYSVVSELKVRNGMVWLFHEICQNFIRVNSVAFIRRNRQCPICDILEGRSKGEDKIIKFLRNHSIFFDKEYSFKDLKSKNNYKLRFDFAIFNDFEMDKLDFLCEYDGEFHYLPLISEERLKKQQETDFLKNNYCKKNNIRLLRIPYWELDNIENILEKEFKL